MRISLTFPNCSLVINRTPTLFQIMAWRRRDEMSLSDPLKALFSDEGVCHSTSITSKDRTSRGMTYVYHRRRHDYGRPGCHQCCCWGPFRTPSARGLLWPLLSRTRSAPEVDLKTTGDRPLKRFFLPANRLFVQKRIQAYSKEKFCIIDPLCWENKNSRWIPRTRGK